MQLRRIVICLTDARRVILYPQGGLDLECFIEGPGWVLDNEAYVPDEAFLALLESAKAVVDDAVEKHTPAEKCKDQILADAIDRADFHRAIARERGL